MAAAVLAMGAVGLVAGSIAWGLHPLTSLSGTTVPVGHSLVLLGESLGIYAIALAGVAAFGLMLSTVTRNSAASVVGTLMFALLMQLLGVLPGTESIRPYLLGTQFDAWHGFLRTPADWTPVCERSGSAPCTSEPPWSPPTSSSSAATSRASSDEPSFLAAGLVSRLPAVHQVASTARREKWRDRIGSCASTRIAARPMRGRSTERS